LNFVYGILVKSMVQASDDRVVAREIMEHGRATRDGTVGLTLLRLMEK
jgi:hypothetical protein